MAKSMNQVNDILNAEEVHDVLNKTFYRNATESARSRKPSKRLNASKAEHYEIICISLYKEDLKRLDDKVGSLKAQGHRKMNRSALIRYALDNVDTTQLPRSY